MKKIPYLLAALCLSFPAFSQNEGADLCGFHLKEKLTVFGQKNGDLPRQDIALCHLPATLLTDGMSAYAAAGENGADPHTVLLFYRGKSAVIAVECAEKGDPSPDAELRARHGPYISKTIYKGHDFNRSGCPTQEVIFWKDNKRILYFIRMPEFHRCQWIVADVSVQEKLKAEKSRAVLERKNRNP